MSVEEENVVIKFRQSAVLDKRGARQQTRNAQSRVHEITFKVTSAALSAWILALRAS